MAYDKDVTVTNKAGTKLDVVDKVEGATFVETADGNFTVAIVVPTAKIIRHIMVTILAGAADSCYDITIGGTLVKYRTLGTGCFNFYPNILTTGSTNVLATQVSGTAAGSTSRVIANYSN